MTAPRIDTVATRWLLVFVLAATICYFSVFSTPDTGVSSLGPFGFVGLDKWYHTIGYGALGALLAIALSSQDNMATGAIVIPSVAIAGATGFGVLMEFAQSFVPARHAGVGDAIADAIGATAAVTMWWLIARRDEADLRA